MVNRRRHRALSASVHEADQFTKALQGILYELLMLATAALLRDCRYHFRKYPDLLWGPPQIAHDVIRLKSRLLVDFFASRGGSDDIRLKDLQHRISFAPPEALLTELRDFTAKVNKWTVHLSWVRAIEPEYDKRDRQKMEEYAIVLLDLGKQFLEECLAGGFVLDGWGEKFYATFLRLHAHLHNTPRVEEGHGPNFNPDTLICLEGLGLRSRSATSAEDVE